MKIERIVSTYPHGGELENLYVMEKITDAEFYDLLNKTEEKYIDVITRILDTDWDIYAVGSNGELLHGEIYDIMDGIVEKDLSYTALVDGHLAIVRTDDMTVYRLYNGATLAQAVWSDQQK